MTPRAPRVGGRLFRYRLTLLLEEARRPMTVAEIVEALERLDVFVPGRASKTISDALRWEVRKGRVRRTAPATYTFGWMPASTGRWMRSELRSATLARVGVRATHDEAVAGTPTQTRVA